MYVVYPVAPTVCVIGVTENPPKLNVGVVVNIVSERFKNTCSPLVVPESVCDPPDAEISFVPLVALELSTPSVVFDVVPK